MSDTNNKCECHECHGCGAELTNKHHWLYFENFDDWEDLTEEERAELEADPPRVCWCMQCVIESGMAYPDEQHCHADECLFCEADSPEFISKKDAEDYGITIEDIAQPESSDEEEDVFESSDEDDDDEEDAA